MKRRCLISLKLLYHTPWSARVQRRILSTANAPNRDWTCQDWVWEPASRMYFQLSFVLVAKRRCLALWPGCITTLAVGGYTCCAWIHRRMLLGIRSVWEPIVCRCSDNLKWNVKSYHIILVYGRGAVTRTLTGWYWSRWYILECHGKFCPAQYTQPELWKVKGLREPDCHNHDITCYLVDVCCCMTMLYGMCQI